MFLDEAPNKGAKDKVWKRVLYYALYFLFWVALSGSGLWLMLEIRAFIVEMMMAASLNPWQVRGFDRWFILILGLGWFIAMLWMEHYLRTAVDKGRLWQRTGYIIAVQAILTGIIFGIRFLIL